jgi:hypothetical protein
MCRWLSVWLTFLFRIFVRTRFVYEILFLPLFDNKPLFQKRGRNSSSQRGRPADARHVEFNTRKLPRKCVAAASRKRVRRAIHEFHPNKP